ncbi:uncharacterized protein LOC126749582 [Anthonomus grandis grandis]|uniref:uncharacterized protein LOC126749582 n=1 Tax=Anthonomus grandis grandis TaxID=2921223 RepID=UPI002165A61B|nr:uncharacterized protein LOC126749582 [Anthonomus grandis grandis]
MGMCFVLGCKHYSSKHPCKFFRFPKNKTEKNRWTSLIRKDRDPSEFAKVCDCHFVNKDKKNGPTLFDFNLHKKFNVQSPEKRKRTVKKVDNCGDNLLTEALPGPSTELLMPGPLCEPLRGTSTELPPGSSKQGCKESQIKLDASLLSPSSASQDAENYFLRQEVAELTEKLANISTRFSYEIVKKNNAHLLMYSNQ